MPWAPPPAPVAQGRVARGRPALSASAHPLARSRYTLVALGLLGATVLSRWPLRGHSLFNWDAIQYALATSRFDLAAHRPHPPGYPGYVLAGRVVRSLTAGDANTALIVLSIVATGLGALALAEVGRRIGGPRTGLVAAALLLLSPLGWFYSETALTYSFDPLISLAGGWFAWRALERGSLRSLAGGCLIVGLLGAVRPTSSLLLLPLLAWTCGRLLRRRQGRPAGALAVAAGLLLGVSVWAVPLVALSGGPLAFLHTSLQLGDAVSASSAVWSTGLRGLLANSRAVLDGLLLSTGIALPVVLGAALSWRLQPRSRRPEAPWPGPGPGFIAIWVGPALLVFCAVHIGQLGYLLFPLPALVLPAAAVLARSGGVLGTMRPGLRRLERPGLAWWGSLAAVGLLDLVLFAGSLAPVLRSHDRAVAAVLSLARSHPPAVTVVLTDPASDGSYRLGLYSLRPYRVLAVGQDRSGRLGELFASDGSAPEYDLSRFDHAGRLAVPSSGYLVILDGPVLGVIGDSVALDDHRLDTGVHVWTLSLRPLDPPLLWGQRIWLRGSDCPCVRSRDNPARAARLR